MLQITQYAFYTQPSFRQSLPMQTISLPLEYDCAEMALLATTEI